MDESRYPFLFETAPSSRTVQRIRETLEIRLTSVKKYVGTTDEYMNGFVRGYEQIIEDLKGLEEQLKYRKK